MARKSHYEYHKILKSVALSDNNCFGNTCRYISSRELLHTAPDTSITKTNNFAAHKLLSQCLRNTSLEYITLEHISSDSLRTNDSEIVFNFNTIKTHALRMDIGNHEANIGSPVLLTLVLLTIIPSSPGYIDCRISCRRCHENTEHPAVLEVYCAMCEECKQRRRERMQGRTTKGKLNPTLKPLTKPTLKPLKKLTKSKQLGRMRDGVEANTDDEALIIRPQENLQYQQGEQDYQGQPQQPSEQQQPLELQQQAEQPPQPPPEPPQPQPTYKPPKALRGMVYPEGCPTPPLCSDSDDEPDLLYVNYTPPPCKTEAPTTTTKAPTTTTTPQPCPPVPSCRKKKKKTTPQSPCMNPCIIPPGLCPCPPYIHHNTVYTGDFRPGDNPYNFPFVPLGYHPLDPIFPKVWHPNYPLFEVKPQIPQDLKGRTEIPYNPWSTNVPPTTTPNPKGQGPVYGPPILVPINWIPPTPPQVTPKDTQTTEDTVKPVDVSPQYPENLLFRSTSTTKSEDFYYLHVGLPNNL